MYRIKVLQLMSYPIDNIINYINENHPYHGHNLYGYIEFSKKEDLQIDWYPNVKAKPTYNGGGIFKRRLVAQLQCLWNASKYDIIYSPHDIHILPLVLLRYLVMIKK